LQYLGAFVVLCVALNPFIWHYPFQAAQAALAARKDLLARQVADTQRLAPQHLLQTPAERSAALLVNLFLAPPSFSEWGNYSQETAQAEQAYLQIPGSNLMRGLAAGGVMLALALVGLALALLNLRRVSAEEKRTLLLLILITFIQAAVLVLVVPLSWQRYTIPLVPFVCLWQAYALARLVDLLRLKLKPANIKTNQGVPDQGRASP
jgi:hypothetical protein